LGLSAATGSVFIDRWVLRSLVGKLPKYFHVSAFALILWTLTAVFGLISHTVFSKTSTPSIYFVEGMMLAIGLRIGLFRSVFGANVTQSVRISFVQPFILLIAFMPASFYASPVPIAMGVAYGLVFIILALVWSKLADRAGCPDLSSTFKVLQAFIAAWTESNPENMEAIMESRARKEVITTNIVKFRTENSKAFILLPDVHPGPFHPIGGSNLPFLLYSAYLGSALILHSVSGHSRNIPSQLWVNKYIRSLAQTRSLETSTTATVPLQVKIGNCISTGIIFGDTGIIILSMAPLGMEDVPEGIRSELERYSSELGLRQLLVVDSHNAMGGELKDSDYQNMLSAGETCVKKLIKAPRYEFKLGFANLDEIAYDRPSLTNELGPSGFAMIALEINNDKYVLGWADSNNMENNLRDYIISKLSRAGIKALDICTSDTHSTSGKRTNQGYYALGNRSDHDMIAELFLQLSVNSVNKATPAKFELLGSSCTIKVMGNRQFDDYALALNKSMKLTKAFLAITSVYFVIMLVLS
jgi:putative membrane protein